MKKILPFIIIVLFLLLTINSISTQSPICDEVAHHIASGYSYLVLGDFRMNPAQPPLIRELIALPLLFLNLELPVNHSSWITNDSPVFGDLFVYENRVSAAKIIFLSKIPSVVLSLMLALFIFYWAYRIYGYKSALLAMFFYCFSPAVLGNSILAMTDIGASLFIFISVFCFSIFLNQKNILSAILAGISLGLALASKHSSILLIFVFFILLIADMLLRKNKIENSKLKKNILYLVFIYIMSLFVVWASYFFEFKPLLVNAINPEEKIEYARSFFNAIPFFDTAWLVENFVYFAKNISIPLSTYIVSLLGILKQSIVEGQGLFLAGKYYADGNRFYYFIDFLLKTPLPLILFIIYSILLSVFKKRTNKNLITNLIVLSVPLTIFLLASLSKLQGGVRYLLPAYPFIFLWISDSVNVSFKKKSNLSLSRFITAVLCIWYFINAFIVYPHYLGYFNELTGGIKGKGYLFTKDFDWGQDLVYLSEYMQKNGIESVQLLYFGTARPAFYNIKFQQPSDAEYTVPKNAVYAVSGRYLESFKWIKNTEYTARAGTSIFIYDLRKQ